MFGIRALHDISVHSICHPSVLIQKSRICDVLGASCKVTKISLLAPMADTNDAVEAPVVVELTEDDIPGAALAESHAEPSLKWWLMC